MDIKKVNVYKKTVKCYNYSMFEVGFAYGNR